MTNECFCICHHNTDSRVLCAHCTPQTDNNLTWEQEFILLYGAHGGTWLYEHIKQAFIPKLLAKRDKQLAEEIINAIPDNLEYYREIATTNKLKNDWDMTQLKDQLRKKYL